MDVYVMPQALVTLSESIRRWYNDEAYGFLHGIRQDETITIERVVDLPAVKSRSPDSVDPGDTKSIQEKLIRDYGPIIGDYHSHTSHADGYPSTNYSEADLIDMRTRPNWLYIIVSARPSKNQDSDWKRRRENEMNATSQGIFLRVAAYLKAQERVMGGKSSKREFEKIPIRLK